MVRRGSGVRVPSSASHESPAQGRDRRAQAEQPEPERRDREQDDQPLGVLGLVLVEQVRPHGSARGQPANISALRELAIHGDMIRLGQLLKLSGLADSGADAKALLLENGVTVNGEPEARRGRQLHRGDVVAVGQESVRVT
jgi:ribosome-associated protein